MSGSVRTLLKNEMLKRWSNRQLTIAIADSDGNELRQTMTDPNDFNVSNGKAILDDPVSLQNPNGSTLHVKYVVITRSELVSGGRAIDNDFADIVWDLGDTVAVQELHSFTIRSIEVEIGDA